MQITVNDLNDLLTTEAKIRLIDVRTSAEFHSERLDYDLIENLPLQSIDLLTGDKNSKIYLICQSGNRSLNAQEALSEIGFTQAVNVTGGLNQCKSIDMAMTKTAGTFPIMRQVQIITGSLTLLGAIGSVYLNANLVWLAAFVGAGLLFAGLSGFCGMAVLLGKMPWNKAMQPISDAASKST